MEDNLTKEELEQVLSKYFKTLEEMEKINGSDITVTVDLSEIAPSEREQKVKALVNIENSYGTVYEKQCLVTVVFKKA